MLAKYGRLWKQEMMKNKLRTSSVYFLIQESCICFMHRFKQNSCDSPCADLYRADTGVIGVRGLHLHHPLCHSAVDGRARGRLLQGHRHGWQRHPADVHEPGHQLPDQRTGLRPELRGARDARVRELHQHDEHHVGHLSDWWETRRKETRTTLLSTLTSLTS